MSARKKDIMRKRTSGVILTDDFNNRYSDITQHLSTWKMYDFLTWADVWAAFITKDIVLEGLLPEEHERYKAPKHCPVSQTFTELVHRFHRACVYFIRPQEETD